MFCAGVWKNRTAEAAFSAHLVEELRLVVPSADRERDWVPAPSAAERLHADKARVWIASGVADALITVTEIESTPPDTGPITTVILSSEACR